MKYNTTYNVCDKSYIKKISQQFLNLKNCMPFLRNKKISKIDILKNANKTISDLEKLYIEKISKNAKQQNIKDLYTWYGEQLLHLRTCFSNISKKNNIRIKREKAYEKSLIKNYKNMIDENKKNYLRNENRIQLNTNTKDLHLVRISENCNKNCTGTPIKICNILKCRNETVPRKNTGLRNDEIQRGFGQRKARPETHFAELKNFNCRKLDFQLETKIAQGKSTLKIDDNDENIENKYDFSVINFSDEDTSECYSYAAKFKSIHGQSPLFSQTSDADKILSPNLTSFSNRSTNSTLLHFNLDDDVSHREKTIINDEIDLDINLSTSCENHSPFQIFKF